MKHRSDLKHASVVRARAEDKEKVVRKDAKVAEDELRLAKEELQAVKGDQLAKMAALKRALQEALEAGNSVECLTEELGRLRIDLTRQEALASRRGEMIAELKDEACTQWASGWLAFQPRASRAFLDLEFNIQLSDEEVEGSASEAEVDADAEVFSRPLIMLLCLAILRFLRGLALLLRLLGLCLLTPLLSRVEAQRQAFRIFFFWRILARSLGFCIASDFIFLLIYPDSLINFFGPFPVSSI